MDDVDDRPVAHARRDDRIDDRQAISRIVHYPRQRPFENRHGDPRGNGLAGVFTKSRDALRTFRQALRIQPRQDGSCPLFSSQLLRIAHRLVGLLLRQASRSGANSNSDGAGADHVDRWCFGEVQQSREPGRVVVANLPDRSQPFARRELIDLVQAEDKVGRIIPLGNAPRSFCGCWSAYFSMLWIQIG